MRMEVDFEEVARMQSQIFELKMSLGVLCCLMEFDIDENRVFATPTRKAALAKAHSLSRFANEATVANALREIGQ